MSRGCPRQEMLPWSPTNRRMLSVSPQRPGLPFSTTFPVRMQKHRRGRRVRSCTIRSYIVERRVNATSVCFPIVCSWRGWENRNGAYSEG